MYQRVNKHDFIEAFRTMGRYDRQDGQGGNFTYEALLALFDYLEEIEAGTGEEMHLDPIALCCDFAEYENLAELAGEYDDINAADDERALDYLRDQTTVIEIPGTDRIVIQSF